jgi:transcriptional regulator with XRE-family HTH domain
MLVIEYARRQQGKTQAYLGGATRIGTYFISLIEQGRAVPSEDQAKRIAKELNLAPEQLLEEAPEVEARRA